MQSLDLEPLSVRSICAAAGAVVAVVALAGAQCAPEELTSSPAASAPQGIDIGTGSITR